MGSPVEIVWKPSSEPETTRRHDDARDGAGQSQQGFRGRHSARQEVPHRYGEVQRRADKGGRDARGRGAPPELEGRARQVLGNEADRDRRAVHGDERAGRRLLAVAGEGEGRGGRMGVTPAHSGGGGGEGAEGGGGRLRAGRLTPEPGGAAAPARRVAG